jgi:hypothetical protein
MEPRDLPSFNAVKITRQTSLNQAPIDKRRMKTIFNHFRDKPARYRKAATFTLKLPDYGLSRPVTVKPNALVEADFTI